MTRRPWTQRSLLRAILALYRSGAVVLREEALPGQFLAWVIEEPGCKPRVTVDAWKHSGISGVIHEALHLLVDPGLSTLDEDLREMALLGIDRELTEWVLERPRTVARFRKAIAAARKRREPKEGV